MKRKSKISIEEQLYRAGIWERPIYPMIDAIDSRALGAIPPVKYYDRKTRKPMERIWLGEKWSEPRATHDWI
jgi:hypothetical protein